MFYKLVKLAIRRVLVSRDVDVLTNSQVLNCIANELESFDRGILRKQALEELEGLRRI